MYEKSQRIISKSYVSHSHGTYQNMCFMTGFYFIKWN